MMVVYCLYSSLTAPHTIWRKPQDNGGWVGRGVSTPTWIPQWLAFLHPHLATAHISTVSYLEDWGDLGAVDTSALVSLSEYLVTWMGCSRSMKGGPTLIRCPILWVGLGVLGHTFWAKGMGLHVRHCARAPLGEPRYK